MMTPRSERNLAGVHPKLVAVVRRALELLEVHRVELSFIVTEGLRTMARQQDLYRAGATRTMNSYHLKQHDGYAHAVDLAATVGGDVRWDWPLYTHLAAAMKQAAQEQEVRITWGGDWKELRDGPHFQLEDHK